MREGNVEVFYQDAWHPAGPWSVIFLTGTDPHGLRNEHTLEEVVQSFQLTRERIRQIEGKALRRLRHPRRARQLRDYLG